MATGADNAHAATNPSTIFFVPVPLKWGTLLAMHGAFRSCVLALSITLGVRAAAIPSLFGFEAYRQAPVASTSGQITVSGKLSQKGWMRDGWGQYDLEIHNNLTVPVKLKSWAAHWEAKSKVLAILGEGPWIRPCPQGQVSTGLKLETCRATFWKQRVQWSPQL